MQEHHVFGTPLDDDFPGLERAMFAMGCFWGAERTFWRLDGVRSTAVGYAGGHTNDPDYGAVCSGSTGHAEVVRVVFDADATRFETLLRAFWEGHDPTQGMRQGNDVGSQYRSGIYCHSPSQHRAAEASRDAYQSALASASHGPITTEIVYPAPTFWFAEDEHQQYLDKHPGGYCGLGGTGVTCAG